MGRELVIYIGNIPSDDIPPFGKFIKFHKHDKFALLCRNARIIRSAEIEKCGQPS